MTPHDRQSNAEAVIEKLFPQNKTPEELVRQSEREELESTYPIVDFRNISKSEHHRYANCWATVPPDVAEQLESAAFPLTPDQVNDIEDRVNEYHDIHPPNAIMLWPPFIERGKCWRFEPALEQTQTGLVYFHNET